MSLYSQDPQKGLPIVANHIAEVRSHGEHRMREFLKIGGPKGNQGVCRENHGITWVLIKAYVGILLGDIHIYDVSAWRPCPDTE